MCTDRITRLTEGTPPSTEFCLSLMELRARRGFAESEGWDVLPFDQPERGTVGFHLIKGDEERRIGFALFGRALEPVESEVRDLATLKDAVSAHEGHDAFLPLQWPISRMIGFVCYCEARNGASRVVKMPFTRVPPGDEFGRSFHERTRGNLGPWSDRKPLRDVLIRTGAIPPGSP
jgi:hypothetical protein